MDASEQFAFPTPQPHDSAEVRAAIERAGELWSEDPKESLRCLRQAAESASDAGDDLRSVQLARTAADLRSLANISASAPPPATMPPNTEVSDPPPPSTSPNDASPDSASEASAASTSVSQGSLGQIEGEERHTEPGNPGQFVMAESGSDESAEVTSPALNLDSGLDANRDPDAKLSADANEEGKSSPSQPAPPPDEPKDPITATSAPSFDQIDEDDDEEGEVVSEADLVSGRGGQAFAQPATSEAETTPNAPPVSTPEASGPLAANPFAPNQQGPGIPQASNQPPGNQPPGNPYASNQPPGNQPPGNPYASNQPPGNQPPGNPYASNQPPGNPYASNQPPRNQPPGNPYAASAQTAGSHGNGNPGGTPFAGVRSNYSPSTSSGIPGPLGVAPGGMALKPDQSADGANDRGPTAAQVAAMVPRMAPGKDPAQTVPATPAASAAAAALATGPSSHQPVSGSSSNFGQAGGAGGPGPRLNAGFGARRPAAALVDAAPAGYNNAPPRAEQPTLIGRPNNNRGLHDQTPAATPAAIQAESSPPASLNSRFVQHRAIAVAISTTPNSSGHFDLHPLAEGEQVEPGFRAALLVGLTPGERIFPGRE